MANALAGGSGWVLLTYVPRDGRLMNQYATEHSQAVAGGIPDPRARHVRARLSHRLRREREGVRRHVHAQHRLEGGRGPLRGREPRCTPPRPLVQQEFGDLPGVGVEEVRAMLDAGKPVQFIDARPRHFVSRTQDIIDGATWRDPERVQEWMGELSKSDPVVVFCAYGFHVGCKTAIALREAGFDASYMKGGHSGWRASGGPVKMYA